MPIFDDLSQLPQCSSTLSGFGSSLGTLSCSEVLYCHEIITEMIFDGYGAVLDGT